MKVTLRTTEHVAVRPYEWIEYSAEVEDEVDGASGFDDLDAALDDALAAARARVQVLATNHESFIHEHPALQGDS